MSVCLSVSFLIGNHQVRHIQARSCYRKWLNYLTMDTQWDLDISRFVPLGFELMAIWIKVNKFSIYLHSQQKVWYNRTCLNTINILQIAWSLQNISIKHINIKINVYFWQPGFKKGDNWNANRTHPFIFSWSAIIGPKFFFTRYNDRNKTTES